MLCQDRGEAEFDGYEYARFKRVAAELGWERGDYNLTCATPGIACCSALLPVANACERKRMRARTQITHTRTHTCTHAHTCFCIPAGLACALPVK